MMTALRSQMKIILWILVVAFLGTIVFSWGMGGFKNREKPGILGEIDGVEITLEGFNELIRRQQELAATRGEEELDPQKLESLREDTWSDEVEHILKWMDARRLGVEVTDHQIAYIVENFPPKEIQEVETFQRDGEFDLQLYRNFLREPSAVQFLIELEESIRSYLMEQELNFHVFQAVDITEEEIRDEYLQQTADGKLSFIIVPFDDMGIDSASITRDMLRRYYQLFSSRFKRYAQRRFAYVKFDLTPTAEDSLDIRREADDLLEELRGGADFTILAEQYSEDPGSAAKGGDLGWFGRGAMVEQFEEAAFAADPGELVGPVKSRFGYHVILVEDRRGQGEDEEVKARHILIKIKASVDTRDEVYNNAYNFAQEAAERDFDEVAAEFSCRIDTTRFFSESGYIPGLQRMRMAAKFCFNNPVGTVSEVYPAGEGYIVFQIVDATEEGIRPFEEVEKTIRSTLIEVLRRHEAWDIAAGLSGQIETPEDLERVAAEEGHTLYKTEDSLRVGGSLPGGLKRDREFLREAFRLGEGKLSDVIVGRYGCYIACMVRKSPWNEDEYALNHPMIYQSMINKKQEAAVNNWVRELRIAANIKDYRYRYFRDF